MSFCNTCDLAIAIPPKQDICDDITEDNSEDDQENMEKEDASNNDEQNKPEDLDNRNEEFEIDIDKEPDNATEDSIYELFSRVFVNDSWSCSSPIEKPYYSAGIYPDVCIECGSLDVNRVTKDEHPRCSGCNSDTIVSKKRLKWKQGGNKDKGKQKKFRFIFFGLYFVMLL
ncbi:unnamed protein product [Rhizophagus irregularis]|nr:unnamed protein product [Rhizophagus irregularis]